MRRWKFASYDCLPSGEVKDVRAQKFPRTDFFKTLTVGKKS